MVRDAPQAALLTMRVQDFATKRPHPEEPAIGGRLEGWITRKPPIHSRYFLAGAHGGLRLHERAVVETAVEPVLIARDVLLHRDVDEGLIPLDARHFSE